VILILSTVVAVGFPLYGLDHQHDEAWRGVFTHKNELGRAMVIGAAIWSVRLLAGDVSRLLSATVLLAFVTVMLLSESRTAIVVTLGLAVFLLWSALFRRRGDQWLAVKGFVFVMLVGLGATASTLYEAALGRLGADADLTGRTDIWAASLSQGFERPILGYGVGAFWRGAEGPSLHVWRAAQYATPHAHNGFLDLFLALGLVGMLAMTWALAVFWRRAIATVHVERGIVSAFPLVFLALYVAYNLTESFLVVPNDLAWIMFVATAEALRDRRSVVGELTNADGGAGR